MSLDIAGDPRGIAPEAQLALIRIAREALTNARRHAPDSPVELRLAIGDEAVLTVRNPVPPGVVAGAGGYGLTGMAERAALVGGEVTAGSDGGFFTVRATVPA